MEEDLVAITPPEEPLTVPESPKPLAFTIDFGGEKSYNNQRHKAFVEKFQNRHKRGQSLSKLEDTAKRHPSTGNLPEGYSSSDERDRRNVRSASNNLRLRSELSLPLKNLVGDKMTQSFPNGRFNLDTIKSPDLELKDVSSPELESPSPVVQHKKLIRHLSSPEVETRIEEFVDGTEFDFDKSDTVSDAGTYTLEADNYTEEQKARMSIDRDFNIEQVSFMKKTEEYIKSLSKSKQRRSLPARPNSAGYIYGKPTPPSKPPKTKSPTLLQSPKEKSRILSPILSPTQNLSIVDQKNTEMNKILYPSSRAKTGIGYDQGCFTSVTSSGAFSRKGETSKHTRQPSLTKSEVQIQTYVDVGCAHSNGTAPIEPKMSPEHKSKLTNLPPAVGGISGKTSPTKIPSPVHSALSRPRSRNSVSSLNIDLSDSSLETESFLKPTQNYINSLQKRLSLDSDPDSDYDNKTNLRLNNETCDLLKQKSLHVRHNSFDDKNLKISNKLEHFHNKNLQSIDQTYTNKLNQYAHKLQNSPNNSPIRRSSSFSNKNQFINPPKVSNLNITTKDINLRNSPNLNGSIQRSSSTANIKPNLLQLRRASVNSEHSKIDRNQFGDTESSSEDDFEKNLLKKKDFTNLTNTRYNRAFSLRRARLDSDVPPPKCPNTPEMRRKFQPEHLRSERAISVDRRPVKTNEVPSRYLQSINKKNTPEVVKSMPKIGTNITKSIPGKPQVISRTDSGRFSVRSSKPISNVPKSAKKDGKKQSGGRSNSSLSSREMEFQNWKRRKSYDPMKAAAEGKKKAEMARKQNQNIMTQSYTENNQNQDCDSSPSHSSSVHRSQLNWWCI
ncbi:hypothetical protein RI129_010943 [Pyrocoelia pectoralis]|uniref:Uncharacterized protein n=1 Tax=Pyrocoelia pectoralis TaxID=417401 RepID=A0AAN7ZEV2_9COLE